MSTTRLHVIDGTATLFRAYFALGKMAAPDGREVGGLLGFGQALARFVRDIRPSHVALVFDAPDATFRHKIYPAYKANRSAPPEDMEHQFDLSIRIADALGFRSFKVPGYEADDLMATFARRGEQAGLETVLVTPDKDVLQLVRGGVMAMDPKNQALQGAEAVVERMGVAPEMVTSILALAGDSTDNIPGVAGVGQKTALALVQALGNIESIYERLNDVPNLAIRGAKSLATKLSQDRERAFLSHRLAILDDRVPLSEDQMTLGMLRYRGPRADANELFDELGFHQPLRSLSAITSPRDDESH